MAKIIVIDDDPDIRYICDMVLSSRGYEVISASNPQEGYERTLAQKPDLIILDVMMNEPDDGFFLAQRFRREGILTPIIMYTSVAKAIGLDYGVSEMVPVNEFVDKPVSPDQLIEKVEKLLKTNQVEG